MCMENFTCCMENCVKIEICLPHSDFVICMGKFCKSSLQQSNFHAYENLHASNKKIIKSVWQLTKAFYASSTKVNFQFGQFFVNR